MFIPLIYRLRLDDGELDTGRREPTERDGRFVNAVLYWMTTTLTSTSTSYTATTTLASIHCTPSGFAVSNCAG